MNKIIEDCFKNNKKCVIELSGGSVWKGLITAIDGEVLLLETEPKHELYINIRFIASVSKST